jgi:hypothetical protein
VVTASGDVVVVCVVCIVERLVPEYLIRASRERAGVRQQVIWYYISSHEILSL